MSHLSRKFFTIMWKNATVRKRHWFMTLLEILVPLSLFYLLAYIHNKVHLSGIDQHTSAAHISNERSEMEILELMFVPHDVVNLAYTPVNEFTTEIMTYVKELLDPLVKSRSYYLKSGTLNVTKCATEKDLEDYFSKIFGNSTENNYMGYGVVFTDTDPKNFHYKLRSTVSSWQTERLFSPIMSGGGVGGMTDQYLFQGFIAMQLAVDKSYIKAVTKQNSTHEIVMQLFPEAGTSFGDAIINIYKMLLPLFVMISFVLMFPSLSKKIVEEKQTGIKELMKMVGLKTWMIWTGWMINSMMVYVVTSVLITILLCCDSQGSGTVISYTHWSIILVLFLLFCIASVAFTFATSAFFYKPTIAMTFGILAWIVSYFVVSNYDSVPFILQMLFCIVPTIAMKECLSVVLIFEKTRDSLTWSNLFSDGLGSHGMSVGIIFLMLILDTIIFISIAWYVDSLLPGPFGRAKPWYFIFKKLSFSKSNEEFEFHQEKDLEQNFESPPSGYKVGISIRDLRKVFPSNVVAVDKVNLEIYEGQITALLGHNGAGKTTTMSILTGMFSPSSGSVFVNNYNIFEQMDDFRSSLGLCPQHNLLFSYLSVIEHLIFFGMLKGLSMSSARLEGLKLLQMLNMLEKKQVMVQKLSGGMKRKLSLAIALIGSPKVLMLDEPTSGMDPESRRELWDLLLSMRGERTIIITTHFMEEADVLGDRIAIMDHGIVRCYGTTLFLKKLYGAGYHLTILKNPAAEVNNITDLISQRIRGVELKSIYSAQVTYSLPQEESKAFPKLFQALEEKKEALGIKGVGISCTTMEEVFLKVGEVTKHEHSPDGISLPSREHTIGKSSSQEALTYKKVKGAALLFQQLNCLIHKKSLYTMRKWLNSIAFIILPLFMLLSTVRVDVLNLVSPDKEPARELRLSDYAYISLNTYIASNTDVVNLKGIYSKLVKEEGSSVTYVNESLLNALLRESEENVEHYEREMLVAGEFNKTKVKAMYSDIPLHAAPIALNLMTQTLLQSYPNSKSNRIFVTNHPLNIYAIDKCLSLRGSDLNSAGFSTGPVLMIVFVWLSLFPQGLLFFVSDFIAFPLSERICNVKQIQLMTGLSHHIYWLSSFIWDYFVYILVTIAMVLVVYFFDAVGMFSQTLPLTVFIVIVLLFGISGLSYAYFFSYSAKTTASATARFLTINIIFGLISSVVMYILLIFADLATLAGAAPYEATLVYIANNILCLNPHYAVITAFMKFSEITLRNYICDQCPDPDKPCKKLKYFSYNKEDKALALNLTYLGLDWILYYALILLIDFGYMTVISHKVKALWIGQTYDHIDQEDSDVRDERDRVDAANTTNGERHTQMVLTANGLVKKFSRSFTAVKGVSFQVAPGECFGLLGVNGAGKTTTFRMLTGDEIPTAGEASIFNYTLANNRSKYLKQIGYCPQFDGINEVLTGEEMLRLFALLRGIPNHKVQLQINDWINLLGLEEYRNRQCGSYSGGNKRKLCAALALIGDPPVVFLDEPTSGVDPVARRNLWDVLVRCQKAGQAIVLTSHSMEECEALCTRLTIMVKGRMMCIGSNQYIKQRYGQGYTILVKLSNQPNMERILPKLKHDIQTTFAANCILKDEHKGLLHYHITDSSIHLSWLFSNMERLKQIHSVVEDYTVSDTTLEQVFIAFAKRSGEN